MYSVVQTDASGNPTGIIGPTGTVSSGSGGGSSGVTSINTRTGAVTLTSTDVGLGNVNNTSDANKPISTAQKAGLVGAGSFVPLTDGATINTDASTGNNFKVTLAGNRTLANPTNLVEGQWYSWEITQDATGGRTLAFGNAFKFGSNPSTTLNTTANGVSLVKGVYNASTGFIDAYTALGGGSSASLPLLPYGTLIFYDGDSIMGHGTAVPGGSGNYVYQTETNYGILAEGFNFWAPIYSGQRTFQRFKNNFGVNGTLLADMLARMDSYTINFPRNSIYVIHMGTNTINQLTTPDLAIAQMAQIIRKCRDKGLRMIIDEVLPKILPGWTPTQEAVRVAYNSWLNTQVASDLQVVSSAGFNPSTMTIVETSNGGTTGDTRLHPNQLGAQFISQRISACINNWVVSGSPLFSSNTDASNRFGNGYMTGTTGTKGSGVTGSVPTSFNVSNNGGGITSTLTTVANPDGGNYLQATLAGTAPSYGGQHVIAADGSALTSQINAGDEWRAIVKVDFDSVVNVKNIQLYATIGGSNSQAWQSYTVDDFIPNGTAQTLILVTDSVVTTFNATTITALNITIFSQAASLPFTGNIRIGSVGIQVIATNPTLNTIIVQTAAFTSRTSNTGQSYTNTGATALVVGTLPKAIPGTVFSYYVNNANGIRALSIGTDVIQYGSSVTGAAGSISSTTIGSSVTLECIVPGIWSATSLVGTWASP